MHILYILYCFSAVGKGDQLYFYNLKEKYYPGPNFPGQPRDTVGTKSVQSRGICPDPAPLLPRGRVGTNVDTFVPGQLSRHCPGTIVPQLLLPGPDSDPGQIQMKSSQCKIIKISINSFQALRSLRY